MAKKMKLRAGSAQEDFVRACYAELLLERAEAKIKESQQIYFAMEDLENYDPDMPDAFQTNCYSPSCEEDMVDSDLIYRLSGEARQVLEIILTTPEEVTKALMKISVTGDPCIPAKMERITFTYLYHPKRLRRYFNKIFGFRRTGEVWEELKKLMS
jgi:hypothetical protein